MAQTFPFIGRISELCLDSTLVFSLLHAWVYNLFDTLDVSRYNTYIYIYIYTYIYMLVVIG